MVKVCESFFPVGCQGNRTAGFYLDGWLKQNIDRCKSVIKQNWDFVFIIDGKEGSGKSVLAQQLAFYLDPSLNLDRVVFSANQFKDAVENSQKYQAIVFDESYDSFTSREGASETSKQLISMMTQIRKKNLFIFVVLPSFFDLNRYIAVYRSILLLHVFHVNFQRGYFYFYNAKKKTNLYLLARRTYNYSMEKPDFSGRFTPFRVLDTESYEKKKDAAFADFFTRQKVSAISKISPKDTQKIKFDALREVALRLSDEKIINKTNIARVLGINRSTLYDFLNKNEKIDDKNAVSEVKNDDLSQ